MSLSRILLFCVLNLWCLASTSNIVIFANGSMSAYFESKAKYATSKSFAVEIVTSPDTITRCIAWLLYSNPNKTILIKNFWTYSPNEIIRQTNVVSPIYVKDANAVGRNTKRIIWFKDLQTNVNPTWDILCSGSTVCFSTLDELQDTSSNSIFVEPMQPQNAPITLSISGAGFIANHPPKLLFATPDRLDISVNVIKNEFIRCIAAKHIDFDAFTDFAKFWALTNPKLDDTNYGEYSIGFYSPPILGSDMYAPREDIRHTLVIKIGNLSMATRYTVSCATSTLPPLKTTSEDSSLILSASPIYQSTRGNTEAILSVYPNYVVANQRTLLHLNTHIRGDNFYKLVGFTRKICDTKSILSPSYLQYRSSKVFVVFNFDDLGKLMICFSGDGGDTFWLQDNNDAIVDITATSRHAITGIIPTWSILGKRTVFELKGRGNGTLIGDGWSKKVGLSLDGCNTVMMDEYIEKDKNKIIFTLQTFDTFDICFSDDYGQHWTLQISPHLTITGYSTDLGAANAKLKFIKLVGVELNRPFHPDIFHYLGVLDHSLKDIQIEYKTFEPKATMNVFIDANEIKFENNYKIPIHSHHIVEQTLISFNITAPNRINKQRYFIAIKRASNWNDNIIQNIQPRNVLSNIDTIWTVYPPIHGDSNLIRIGFILDDEERSDCRLPQISIPIDKYSQTTGDLVWNYYGIAIYRVCYTIDGGKMWSKQISDDAIVVVDGSYLRTPWHIATFILVLTCLFCQYYCARLRKMSK